MICVMFRFGNNVTTEDGQPLTKVYDLSRAIHGIKHEGFRPEIAYIFAVLNPEEYVLNASDFEKDNVHKRVSSSLHPRKGEIVYQNETVRKLFAL